MYLWELAVIPHAVSWIKVLEITHMWVDMELTCAIIHPYRYDLKVTWPTKQHAKLQEVPHSTIQAHVPHKVVNLPKI